jgi:hypothetical protein
MLGGPPTHPELLDWLTLRFVRNGWTFKDLHRLIVTSATYRQSTSHPQLAAFQTKDPLNHHYWRFNTRRLDAEQIRDAILSVSGQLDLTPGGPGVQADVPRRSIYLRVMRNERDSLLDVFDLPLFFSSTSSRDTTTSPVQSLLLFNSQVMMNHGLKFALSLMTEAAPESDADSQKSTDRISAMWQRAFGRRPTEDEVRTALQFLSEQQERIVRERGEMEAAAIPVGRLPYREGQAVVINPDENLQRMVVEPTDVLNADNFTVEACIQIRSIRDTGAVRTIAARWNGTPQSPGWAFGVTGKASRRKPQTLVMQLFGRTSGGLIQEAALFSDQTVELNTPYLVAASVKLATGGPNSGTVTFHLKNLSNDDEPLSTVTVAHSIVEGLRNIEPLTIGFRSRSADSNFDGLIDDVRLSDKALKEQDLLINMDSSNSSTIGFWRFEPLPGLLEDSSGNALRLSVHRNAAVPLSTQEAALADLCHVILNSNEFLYVR